MKKRLFKFGAALTAALMMFSATASLAFADEVDAETPETIIAESETVDEVAPEEEAVEDETPAEDAEAPEEDAEDVEIEEVVVPLETEEIDIEDVDDVAVAAAADVATGSVISIGEITSGADDSYFTVSVPFSVDNAPSQMTLFVYNITSIVDGNNQTAYSATTPVGYINQYAGAATGTYTFKLSKDTNKVGDTIVVKIGGTDVTVPDAKSYTLADGPVDDVTLGDVDLNGEINMDDAILTMQYYLRKATLTDQQVKNANVVNSADSEVDMDDAIAIMQYYLRKITSF